MPFWFHTFALNRPEGIYTPGVARDHRYRVAMRPQASPAQFHAAAKSAFPDAGWGIRDRNDAAPGLRRFVEQITMFLTLVGLTALAVGGVTPARLLDQAGALGPRSTVVHATHLTGDDIGLLGGSRSVACFCPTTEADLADGIGPARALADAGCPLSLGSDSHAVVDLLAEARLVEMGERLAGGRRGSFRAEELATAATVAGHACLGWPEAGEIAPGALADLVTVALDTPRLAGVQAGTALESVIFAGSAADVRNVVIGGRDVVAGGRHLLVDDVPAALDAAIAPLLSPA